MANMLDDFFIVSLIEEFRITGYGMWCGLLEIYAAACTEENCGKEIEIPKRIFTRKLHVNETKMKKFFHFCETFGKIRFTELKKSFVIEIPKMLDYRDEWTKKKNKNSGVTPSQVTLQRSDNRDQITEERSLSHERDLSGERDFPKKNMPDEFADQAEDAMLKSANPNMQNIGWVRGYVSLTAEKFLQRRKDCRDADVMAVWRDVCFDCSAKAAGSANYYKKVFEARLEQYRPGVTKTKAPVEVKPYHERVLAARRVRDKQSGREYAGSDLRVPEYLPEGVRDKHFVGPSGEEIYFVDILEEER